MPDSLGFDHLPDRNGSPLVRCIDCGEGGELWRWTRRVRERHFAKHESARRRAAAAHKREVQREATRRLRAVNRLRKEARA